MNGTPYMAFGNDEINSSPDLTDPVHCHNCGGEHPIREATKVGENHPHSDPVDPTPGMSLQFITCEERSFLVGINGKDIRGRGSSGRLPDDGEPAE